MSTDYNRLAQLLKIKFNNPKLLKEALTHRSFLNETAVKIPSNERLEFLGDAVLELLVSNHLFKTFVSLPEGKLTNLRSAIVNTKTLASVAKRLHLGEYLRLSKGEEAGGGRENASLLADAFEAVLGAIFIDQSLTKAEEFLGRELFPVIHEVIKNGSYQDYKSLLQERTQEKYKVTPTYAIIKEEGPDHAKTFFSAVYLDKKKIGEGKGKSKQEAEADAARNALERGNGL